MGTFARGSDCNIIMLLAQRAADGSISREIVTLGAPISATFDMQVTNERDDRLGEAIARTDQYYEGENVSLEYKRESAAIERIKAAIRDAHVDRLPAPKFQVLRTIEDRNTGTVSTVRYTDLVANISESVSGKNEAITTTVEMMGGKAETLSEG